MWKILKEEQFNKQFKKLSSSLQARVLEAYQDMIDSADPTHVGRHKTGKYSCFYGYDIGLQYRILYSVNWEIRAIVLYRVGTHKEVY